MNSVHHVCPSSELLYHSFPVSAQDGNVALRKAHTCSAPPRLSAVSLRLPSKQCQSFSGRTWIIPDLRGWTTSFLHSSFLQAVNAVMLWPVHVQNVPQASEHLCPAKLQTRCAICCACQFFRLFIPTDSSMPRAVDPQKSLQPKTVHGCVPFTDADMDLDANRGGPAVELIVVR